MKLKNYKELFEKYEDTDYEDESYYNDDDYLFGRPSHSKKGRIVRATTHLTCLIGGSQTQSVQRYRDSRTFSVQ